MGNEPALILALDVTEREKALDVATKVKGQIFATKLNWPAILGCGKEIIGEIKVETGRPVIADLKLADIDNTVQLITEQVFGAGADYVIAHPFIGKDPLQAIPPEKLILIVEMSHPGAVQFIQPLTEQFCAMAVEMGVWGVVAPATRPARILQIRQWIGRDMKILCPGVGAQGGTAHETIDSGADYIIAGRAIYNSEDPALAAKKILEKI